jgi:threonine/homoserine/homoserine lactone efflux protein
MLNMTALKISIETGRPESLRFSAGAAFVVFIQASIALIFVDFFVRRPEIVSFLEGAAVFVFFGLAVGFYLLSRKKVKVSQEKTRRYFLRGMGMSSLNMLAIPYYLALGLYLAAEGKLQLELLYKLLFTTGAALGTMLLFFTYVSFGRKIAMRVAFIVRNINLILSMLFIVLGILALVQSFR